MKAAVVCDNWKLPTFRELLGEAGYTWDETPFTGESTTMQVEVTNLRELQDVVMACERTAQEKRIIESN